MICERDERKTGRPSIVLKLIDFLAMGVALFGIVGFATIAIVGAARGVMHQLGVSLGRPDEVWVLVAVVAAVNWCFFRRKRLTEPDVISVISDQ